MVDTNGLHLQDEVLRHSLQDPESFWSHHAHHLHWHKDFSKALKWTKETLKSGESYDSWEWFPDGEISTCFNCLDRHVLGGQGESVAIYYDSPVTQTKEKYTYSQLLDEVEILAGCLREEGVKKGDVVMIYMPQIPAAIIAIMAINRLGAIHSTVFGGFAPKALAQRMESCKPVALLTASCGIDGRKQPVAYKPLVEKAISLSSHRTTTTLVWQREQLPWLPLNRNLGQMDWQQLVSCGRARNVRAECVPVSSTDPVYIIHTSGTTGSPKGVVRDSAGHAVALNLSISYVYNIHGPGHVLFTASDLGWVLGHTYIVYGPLLAGAATVLYEGKPIGTPDASAYWRLVKEYKVNTLFSVPSALQAIKRSDPENRILKEFGTNGHLRSLKAIFLAGERAQPDLVRLYQDLIAKYGAFNAHVIDNWWSTESGSPITARALVPHTGKHRRSDVRGHQPPEFQPGSAGRPMPGFNVKIVNDNGIEVKQGTQGNIVLGLPLAPSAFRTLWEDQERFFNSYLRKFNGKYLDTGDEGYMDQDGNVFVTGRSDDVLNVSAHRLSSGSIEQAINSHPLVAESCIVGLPDAVKGHVPFAIVSLNTTKEPVKATPDDNTFAEIQNLVRQQVGAIASIGGAVQGWGIVPKTRSGKPLRRVLREMIENASRGEFDRPVTVPSTIEDASVVDAAQAQIREYFAQKPVASKSILKAKL